MFPFIHVFGITIPMYSVMMLTGTAAACLWLKLTERRRVIHPADMELVFIYSLTGAAAGAKILYILTVFDTFIQELDDLVSGTGFFAQKYVYGGFVFYGGVIGAFAAGSIYCRVNDIKMGDVIIWMLPVLPLIHAFGRVGCFFAGCCYGIESESFGVVFAESQAAPQGVPLIPVQLMEAGTELVLFAVLAVLALRGADAPYMAALWMICYGAVRFGLEFLRGDECRGFIGVLSISQVLSLILIGCGLAAAAGSGRNRRYAGAS